MGGGQRGLEPPHFAEVYMLKISLKTTLRWPQKRSFGVKNSNFSWESMPPDPPRQLMVVVPGP